MIRHARLILVSLWYLTIGVSCNEIEQTPNLRGDSPPPLVQSDVATVPKIEHQAYNLTAKEINVHWLFVAGGSAQQLSVNKNGKSIWVADTNNKPMQILGPNGPWINISGQKTKRVYTSGNYKHIWGVTDAKGITYRRVRDRNAKKGEWEDFSDKDYWRDVSVNHCGNDVWAVSTQDKLYWRKGGPKDNTKWKEVTVKKCSGPRTVHISGNGKIVFITDKCDKVCWYDIKADSWTQMNGSLLQLSSDEKGNNIWGVNDKDEIWYAPDRSSDWQKSNGRFINVSVSGDGKCVWTVDTDKHIYYSCSVPRYNMLDAEPENGCGNEDEDEDTDVDAKASIW